MIKMADEAERRRHWLIGTEMSGIDVSAIDKLENGRSLRGRDRTPAREGQGVAPLHLTYLANNTYCT